MIKKSGYYFCTKCHDTSSGNSNTTSSDIFQLPSVTVTASSSDPFESMYDRLNDLNDYSIGSSGDTTKNNSKFYNSSIYFGFGAGFKVLAQIKSYPIGLKINAVAMPDLKVNKKGKFKKSKKAEFSAVLSLGVYEIKFDAKNNFKPTDKFSMDENKVIFNFGGGVILHGEANIEYTFDK